MCFSCHFTPLASSHIREWWVNNPRNETHCIDIGSTPIRRRWLDPYGRLWKDKIRLVKMKHLLQKRVYRRAFCCWLIGAKEMRSWSSAKNIKDSKSVCVCENNQKHMYKWSTGCQNKQHKPYELQVELGSKFQMLDLLEICCDINMSTETTSRPSFHESWLLEFRRNLRFPYYWIPSLVLYG